MIFSALCNSTYKKEAHITANLLRVLSYLLRLGEQSLIATFLELRAVDYYRLSGFFEPLISYRSLVSDVF